MRAAIRRAFRGVAIPVALLLFLWGAGWAFDSWRACQINPRVCDLPTSGDLIPLWTYLLLAAPVLTLLLNPWLTGAPGRRGTMGAGWCFVLGALGATLFLFLTEPNPAVKDVGVASGLLGAASLVWLLGLLAGTREPAEPAAPAPEG